MPTALQTDIKRWYKLKPIVEQIRLIESKARFKVVAAGRRSGKTERAKRAIIKACMKVPGNYFIAAPTYAQVKLIYWDDVKRLAFTSIAKKSPSESELIVYFANGSKLYLIGLDKPKRIEGPYWMGGIVDETAYIKSTALLESVLPALDTENPELPGYKAWCWFIGKPFGQNHFYKLYQYAKTANDSQWAAFHWLSSEVLDADTIAAAKRRMSKSQYEQEYEAAFNQTNGRIYPDYNELNYTQETIRPHEQLLYFCDFNYTPMSHGIGVRRPVYSKNTKTGQKTWLYDNYYLLDEIILKSAIAEQNMLEFVEKYKNHKNKNVIIYGDASGKAGEKHAQESNYTMMEKVLHDAGWTFQRKVPGANPRIIDRQNCLRAQVCTADGLRRLFVNPTTAPWINEGMLTVSVKAVKEGASAGSSFIEDDTNEYQHIITGVGYMMHMECPIIDDSECGFELEQFYG